jgi:hypothetical protein
MYIDFQCIFKENRYCAEKCYFHIPSDVPVIIDLTMMINHSKSSNDHLTHDTPTTISPYLRYIVSGLTGYIQSSRI